MADADAFLAATILERIAKAMRSSSGATTRQPMHTGDDRNRSSHSTNAGCFSTNAATCGALYQPARPNVAITSVMKRRDWAAAHLACAGTGA